MPKDSWRTSSSSYRRAIRNGVKNTQPKKPRRVKKKPGRYLIPAGTVCQVCRSGKTPWINHTTQRDVIAHGFIWRNQTHYGFAVEGYDVKVEVGLFNCLDGEQQ